MNVMHHFQLRMTKILNSTSTTRFVGSILAGLFAIVLLVIQLNIWQDFPEWIAVRIFKV